MTPAMPLRLGPRSVPPRGCRAAVLGAVAALAGGAACEKDKLRGPEAEVRKSAVKLDLPPVPGFELPPPNPDGSHSVKELRVKGKKLLETDIVVKGVVTWVYDCKTALRQPGMSDKEVEALIYDDPTRCERQKLYLGDSADTPAERSLWVVDIPRPLTKLQLERMRPRAQLEELNNPSARRCDAKKKGHCPVYEVGDQVEIAGTWRLSSLHGERNSDGLLIYKRMKNLTKGWESPELPAEPSAADDAAPAGRESPEDLVNRRKPG
jgi:hypothetical protein